MHLKKCNQSKTFEYKILVEVKSSKFYLHVCCSPYIKHGKHRKWCKKRSRQVNTNGNWYSHVNITWNVLENNKLLERTLQQARHGSTPVIPVLGRSGQAGLHRDFVASLYVLYSKFQATLSYATTTYLSQNKNRNKNKTHTDHLHPILTQDNTIRVQEPNNLKEMYLAMKRK